MKRLYIFITLSALYTISYSQDLEYAKSVISKLASPELKGRGYTGSGNFLAAEFISGEYKRFGLEPFGKSYYQKFDIPINTFPGKIALLVNGEPLKPGIDYVIESSSPGIKGKYNVIKIKRKDIDTQEKLISVIKNVGDNFILIDDTEKLTDNKALNKKTDDYIAFLKYSPEFSCKGILVFTKNKLNWENSTTQNIRPIVIINKDLDLNSFSSIELTIESTFIKKYQTQNIVGYSKGRSEPDSFLVVIAHYDHLGQMGNEVYFPGANDNASGIAMILNLAEYYSKNKPKYSIVFIALSAEEVGILGAKEFTDNPLIKLKKIKFLINFDLAGTGEEGIRVVNGSVYKDKFDLLTKINTENKLLPKVDIRGEACNSDHCLFYQKGVPCFYIYTQGGIQAYHDIYDKSDTLPLTEFVDYCTLIIKFFERI
jgi:aminopeptidase YwaD